jgi:hypothetical protein
LPRNALLIGTGAVLLAVAVPAVLLARVARSDVATQIAPPPERPVRVIVASRGESGRIVLAPGPFPPAPDARYALRVSVGSNRPLARFALDLRDGAGRRLSSCEFGAHDYDVETFRQITLLTCPLREARALETVTFVAEARRSDIAIWGRRRAEGGFAAGGLLAGQPRGVSAALDRLAVARPRLFRGPTLLVALGLSLAVLGAAGLSFWWSPIRLRTSPHEAEG